MEQQQDQSHASTSVPANIEGLPVPSSRRSNPNHLVNASLDGDHQEIPLPRDNTPQIQHRRPSRLLTYFQTSLTSGESARDFLARERTYFSWIRLSTWLSIASVALFLRLRLRDTDSFFKKDFTLARVNEFLPVNPLDTDSSFYQIMVEQRSLMTWNGMDPVQNALKKKMMRRFLSQQTKTMTTKISVDTNVDLSTTLGVIFFLLATSALVVGHVDYMQAERALEHADEVVPPPRRHGASSLEESEAIDERAQQQSDRQAEASRGAAVVRWHDARYAKSAHSGRLVHLTEITIALSVFATAVIILATEGSVGISGPKPEFRDVVF